MHSPSNSLADQHQGAAVSEPAEPCPTPLSTAEVFDSFAAEGKSWEIAGPYGSIQGHTLGQGPALYFLNGLEGTSELFRLLAWLLREEFRCVLFDCPAAGEMRTAIDDPSELPDVRQLFAVADGLADERFAVYGSGFGGWLALAAMLGHGERIRAAVLQAAYARRRFKLLEKLLLRMARRSSKTFHDVPGWRAVFQQNHKPWFPPFDAARFELFQHIAGSIPVRDFAQRVRQLQNVRIDHRLGEITRSVLLLNSEGEGRLLRQRQKELERALPQVRSEWLQNSGLVPHWTHPHRVTKLIRQFLLAPSGDEQTAPASEMTEMHS